MKLSVLIPAYNEERTIKTVLNSIFRLKIKGIKIEVVVIDDGSVDHTSKIIREHSNNGLIFIKHKTNQGKGVAIRSGIKKATGDIILIQDADLEYDPKYIPVLIKPILDKEAFVVYGTRLRVLPIFFGKDRTPFLLHFFGNKFLSFVTTILYGSVITDMETGYKVFTKEVIRDIKIKSNSFAVEPELTAKILKRGIKIVEIDIKTKPRSYKEGKKIRPIKDGIDSLITIVKYRFID